ncbi:MAG: IS200/IS605 family transposase [Bacteroidales bacterium]|nr:IS200/IS605 family transposase [Bacteroidales bacterium]
MDKRWKTSAGSVYNVAYHIIWCPKYRRRVLVPPIDARLKELVAEKCYEQGWTLGEIEVLPDHVHVFVWVTPSDSPAHVASQMKGYTAFALRGEFPSLRRKLPSLWTRSYYVESVGHISEDTIRRYIENQKNK